MTQYNMGLA